MLSRDEGTRYVLGNPGSGLASDFPKAERTYDAMTVALRHDFPDGWLAQASYTWSRLYGNDSGPFRDVSSRSGLEFVQESLFHPACLHDPRAGLSGPLGHARQLSGGNPAPSGGETFVLPRGSSGERTPWAHSIDTQLVLNHRVGKGDVVSLTLDVFNLFNFQRATRVDEHYTHVAVLPLGTPLTEADLNPDFKQPLQYQTPRQVRVGLRYAF